jgi:hypothetical protein
MQQTGAAQAAFNAVPVRYALGLLQFIRQGCADPDEKAERSEHDR